MSGTKVAELIVEDTKRDAERDARLAFGGAQELCSYGRVHSAFVTPSTPPQFKAPAIPVDLSIGSESVLDEELVESVASMKESFNDFLKAIVANSLSFDGVNFLSFRNNLTKLLSTPYERNEWEIDLAVLHGVICLGIVKLESNLRFESKYHRDTVYWGYRFEDVCTGLRPDAPFEDPATKDKFYTINKVKLGKYTLMIGAEIDSYEFDGFGARRYVEIKTSKQINEKSDYSFRRGKLYSCYLQSKIVDVPKIVMGFRDERGIVREVKEYPVDTLPQEGRDWDPSVCISFTTRVLHFLRLHARPGFNYRLTNHNGRISLFALHAENSFIPSSFAEYIKTHQSPAKAEPPKEIQKGAIASHSTSSTRSHSAPRADREPLRPVSSHRSEDLRKRTSRHSSPPTDRDQSSRPSYPSHEYRREHGDGHDPEHRGLKRLRESGEPPRTTLPPSGIECRFGRACRRKECAFRHPFGRMMDETAPPGSAPSVTGLGLTTLLVHAPDLLTEAGAPPLLTTAPPPLPVRASSTEASDSVTPAYPSLVRKRFRD